MTLRIIITGGTFDKQYDAIRGQLTFKDTHLPDIIKQVRSSVPQIRVRHHRSQSETGTVQTGDECGHDRGHAHGLGDARLGRAVQQWAGPEVGGRDRQGGAQTTERGPRRLTHRFEKRLHLGRH